MGVLSFTGAIESDFTEKNTDVTRVGSKIFAKNQMNCVIENYFC
jgi:hypothetical protein